MKSASQIHRLSSELVVIVGPIALRFSGFKEALPVAVRETFAPWLRALPDVSIVHRASISLGNTQQRHFSLEVEHHHVDWAQDSSRWQLARPATDLPADWIRWIDCATRTICQAVVAQIGGELLHGATLKIGGTAWIVLGQSGRGKSTLFNLMGGYDAGHLHDDKIILWDNRAWTLPAESSETHPSQVLPKALIHGGYLSLGERSSPPRFSTLPKQTLRSELSNALVETLSPEGDGNRVDWILRQSLMPAFQVSYDAEVEIRANKTFEMVRSGLETFFTTPTG